MTKQAFDSDQLKKLSSLELLRLHAALIDVLAERKIVGSKSNPVADYAECLVSKALSLALEGKSNKESVDISESALFFKRDTLDWPPWFSVSAPASR